MFGRLLLLFIVTPLVELWLLMAVSKELGPATTIWIVLLTGFVGASLSRRQGLQTWLAIQKQTQQGQMPTAALVDAMMIFVAGVLLITPGIMTDIVGFSLLVPPIRALLRAKFRNSIKVKAGATMQGFGAGFPGQPPEPSTEQTKKTPLQGDVIDVEYERHTDD